MRVALFVTCLVDLFRPSVGFATLKLLNQAGCRVEVPENQTCCGQPAYNNGDRVNAAEIARQVISTFHDYEYVVVPSGSCAGMLKVHYPALLRDDPDWSERALSLSRRVYEISQFLTQVVHIDLSQHRQSGTVTYHDSCSCLRELHIKSEPRNLLAKLDGLQLAELPDTESCCGFGGTFCVKYPEISGQMVNEKVNNILATGADMLVSADLGCLLNIAGRLKYLNQSVRVFHLTELLAGMTGTADIGGKTT